jgi:hypothetical protein
MRPWTGLRRAVPLATVTAVTAAALLQLALLSAPASAASTSPVITDCNTHSQLTQHYTVAQLRTALNTMPPTVKEYTNCYDVINRALLAQVGSGSGSGGGGSAGQDSGGSFLPVWLIIVLGLLIVGGGTYAFLAYRRQASLGGEGGSGPEAGPGPTAPE